jgi:hypothetical protein
VEKDLWRRGPGKGRGETKPISCREEPGPGASCTNKANQRVHLRERGTCGTNKAKLREPGREPGATMRNKANSRRRLVVCWGDIEDNASRRHYKRGTQRAEQRARMLRSAPHDKWVWLSPQDPATSWGPGPGEFCCSEEGDLVQRVVTRRVLYPACSHGRRRTHPGVKLGGRDEPRASNAIVVKPLWRTGPCRPENASHPCWC